VKIENLLVPKMRILTGANRAIQISHSQENRRAPSVLDQNLAIPRKIKLTDLNGAIQVSRS
jgi:hypothetical protein